MPLTDADATRNAEAEAIVLDRPAPGVGDPADEHQRPGERSPRGRLFEVLAWAILPFRKVSLRRWLDILVLGVVGLCLALFIAAPVTIWSRRWGEAYGQGPIALFASIVTVVVALLFLPLVVFGSLRVRQLWRLAVYPPAWVAAVLASGAAFLLKKEFDFLPIDNADVANWAWAAGVCALSATLVLITTKSLTSSGERRASRADGQATSTSAETLRAFAREPDKRLIPWLLVEEPVQHPQDDLFEHRLIAQRIAESFFSYKLGTVGLTGRWGGGKSTVLGMVEHYLHRDRPFHERMCWMWKQQHHRWRDIGCRRAPRIITCTVSAWGLAYESGPALILRQAIAVLSQYVDCTSVITLPTHYDRALKDSGVSWLQAPLALCSAAPPVDQLRRLDPILRAINARLVVFLEDLDRNTAVGGPPGPIDGSLQQIQAMLNRLRGLEQVSFVLAVSGAES